MAEQPMSHIRPQRVRFASLQATIPSGLSDADGVKAGDLANFPERAVYAAGKDVPVIQARGCRDLACLPYPCHADFGYATTIDMYTLSGCANRCSVDIDWQRRNIESMEIAEGDLLARFLWDGIGGIDQASANVVLPATQQTTILNAGASAGTASTLDTALSQALMGIENQSYYGQPILWVPRALLGLADSRMWEIRGDRVTFAGVPVVAIGGPRLGGLVATSTNYWVAATGPVEWFLGEARTKVLQIRPQECDLEQGERMEKPGMIRMATWPTPQLVEIA